jgi:TRAP transporter TAXI family solute receptor
MDLLAYMADFAGRRTRRTAGAGVLLAALALVPAAGAQTFGLVTMQPGTLNHTTGSAIAKVLKDKGSMNALVQPTAGESVLIVMVNRGEADLGIANLAEVMAASEVSGRQSDLRLIGAIHPLRTAFFVRKDSPMKTTADLKGKKVVYGFSAQRTLGTLARAILATGGVTESQISPVMVPNVIRGADDFVSGAADVFFFAFGAPKVREVDATVGGIRVIEVPESGMPAAQKIFPAGYLTQATPGPFFVGVDSPMGVYTWDNMLFTNAKVKDEVVYKIIETMENSKADLVSVQPALREFSAAGLYKKLDIPYHPGALRYFADKKIEAKAIQ